MLVSTSLLFLLVEYLTHLEFLFHLSAIPLEILAGVFIVGKFLDYAIELKESQPNMFYELISDYELSSQIRSIRSEGGEKQS